jgi:heme/copper-type cytochrome/quinol oxidase subunit 3
MASEGVGPPPSDLAGRPGGTPADVGAESPAVRRARGIRALDVAARLMAGSTAFFFLSFLFAYFYLRALNQEHMFRPAGIKPTAGLGVAFVVCIIVSAGLGLLALRRQRSDSPGWVMPATVAVVLGLAAVALQCIEYTVPKWGPTNGSYASIYLGWTAFFALFVLMTMYWLWIQVATEIRERRESTARPGEGETVYEDPDKLLQRGIDASVFYWTFLAATGVVMYIVLYLL